MEKEIFILEDDKDIGFILNHVLFDQGYRVQVYERMSDIRQALQAGFPDLLLMDVRLPDGNGMDLCAEIKEQETVHVPIIMMSAHLWISLATSPRDIIIPNRKCCDGLSYILRKIEHEMVYSYRARIA